MLHGAGGLVAWRPLSGPGRLLLVASDAVGAVAALIIVVFALGGAFPKSPRLLVDATAFGRAPPQVLIVHGVTRPLHLLIRLPLPELQCQRARLRLDLGLSGHRTRRGSSHHRRPGGFGHVT